MRKVVLCKEAALPVVVKQRSYDVYFCPHCNSEIREKGTWYDVQTKTDFHRECGKPIEFPKSNDDLNTILFK